MSDFAVPNARPGKCEKCRGSGQYRWHAASHGRPIVKSGQCNSCGGTGRQTRADIARNHAYNRYKISNLSSI